MGSLKYFNREKEEVRHFLLYWLNLKSDAANYAYMLKCNLFN